MLHEQLVLHTSATLEGTKQRRKNIRRRSEAAFQMGCQERLKRGIKIAENTYMRACEAQNNSWTKECGLKNLPLVITFYAYKI
jgi:hypothetical protein